MSTLKDVLRIQREKGVLMAPAEIDDPSARQLFKSQTPASLKISLRNNTSSSQVFCNISGLAMDNGYRVFLLQSDGASAYFPNNPKDNQQPLEANCTILLGAPGTTRTVTIPHIVGGRIWFSVGAPLTFARNHGDNGVGLVEPSVTNPTDPSYFLSWAFVEFTYNDFQLFANLTYVDFVSIPVALRLESNVGPVQDVLGLPPNGLDSVCNQLRQQNARDGAGWDKLVVPAPGNTGRFLRALSPNDGIILDSQLFKGYWQPYVDAVWDKYYNETLLINTQVQWGDAAGSVSDDGQWLKFGNIGSFPQPSSRDIFSCSTGAFANYKGDEDTVNLMANIGARIAAAFNRSTLLINSEQPDGERVENYYRETITNHYARILHGLNLDHRGYAFPYDDVAPSGNIAADQMGAVASETPNLFTVLIGGGDGASRVGARDREEVRRGQQLVGGKKRLFRRGLQSWVNEVTPAMEDPPAKGNEAETETDEKEWTAEKLSKWEGPSAEESFVDAALDADVLEEGRYLNVSSVASKADYTTVPAPSGTRPKTLRDFLPETLATFLEGVVARLTQLPTLARFRPALEFVLTRIVGAILALPVRSFLSKIGVLCFLGLVYLASGPVGKVLDWHLGPEQNGSGH
jgi:hypothetical protein